MLILFCLYSSLVTSAITGKKNSTTVTRFILLGFSEFPKLTFVLFSAFLGIYLMTVSWNVSLITLIRMDSHLHTPMYFFLSNLSFLDISYISTTVPKMLADFLQKHKFISFMGCTLQYFFFSGLGLTECCLLAAMAYDRYVAICSPLLYTAIMSPTLCVKMVVGSWITGFLGSSVQLCALLQLNFCGPNVINHFFCDLPQLLILSCSGIFFFQVLIFVMTVIFGLLSSLVIMISYGYIVATILKITSVEGRSKAFNTCASHLTAVTLFFGSGIFVYLFPNSGDSLSQNKLASILYTVLIPMLNPLIYSLRNKEIKDALNRWKKRMFS
ncbi:olfactory receptor 5AN6 [Ochotona princeps]|uniref:olfactory receptor 5AN6 n=1 Tax=Ochotona princeps TaxID=9978 RepID=UPI002714A618|nr:olfactory receptor 5AN6 [Ochotona princeps]